MDKVYKVSAPVSSVRLTGEELRTLEGMMKDALFATPPGSADAIREFVSCVVGDTTLRPKDVAELLSDPDAPDELHNCYISLSIIRSQYDISVGLYEVGGSISVKSPDKLWADGLIGQLGAFLREHEPFLSYRLLKPMAIANFLAGAANLFIAGYMTYKTVSEHSLPSVSPWFSYTALLVVLFIFSVQFTVMNPKRSPATRIAIRERSPAWWRQNPSLLLSGLTLLFTVALFIVAILK